MKVPNFFVLSIFGYDDFIIGLETSFFFYGVDFLGESLNVFLGLDLIFLMSFFMVFLDGDWRDLVGFFFPAIFDDFIVFTVFTIYFTNLLID